MMERSANLVEREGIIWGPLLLLCTFAVSPKSALSPDLLFVALSGLYLSARFQIRGFCYALALLLVGAAGRHFLFVENHLFQAGLETSFAFSFFITALAFEEGSHLTDSLNSAAQNSKNARENLEEDFNRIQKEALNTQIAMQEKTETLQKELDELHTEHSSLLVLNEVLRKTTARHTLDNSDLTGRINEAEKRMKRLQMEVEQSRQDTTRAVNGEELAQENKKLLEELNVLRTDQEQTLLLGETHARIAMRETLKAKDAEAEAASLSERLSFVLQELDAAHRQTRAVEEAKEILDKNAALKTEVAKLQTEKEKLELELQVVMAIPKADPEELACLREEFKEKEERLNQRAMHALEAAEKMKGSLQKIEDATSEAREGFAKKTKEVESLREKLSDMQMIVERLEVTGGSVPKEDPELATQLKAAHDRIAALAFVEAQFKQLRHQFEEKNKVLHQARTEYFKADTELQRLKMEQDKSLDPIPKELQDELTRLAEQIAHLEEENRHMQDLITMLSDVKKK